jgi:hypothetical protein
VTKIVKGFPDSLHIADVMDELVHSVVDIFDGSLCGHGADQRSSQAALAAYYRGRPSR